MKICQVVLKLSRRHKNCCETHTLKKKENYIPNCMHTWYAGDITRVGKPELRLMCSARHLNVFNVCVMSIHVNEYPVLMSIHENMSSGFKVIEWT